MIDYYLLLNYMKNLIVRNYYLNYFLLKEKKFLKILDKKFFYCCLNLIEKLLFLFEFRLNLFDFFRNSFLN